MPAACVLGSLAAEKRPHVPRVETATAARREVDEQTRADAERPCPEAEVGAVRDGPLLCQVEPLIRDEERGLLRPEDLVAEESQPRSSSHPRLRAAERSEERLFGASGIGDRDVNR